LSSGENVWKRVEKQVLEYAQNMLKIYSKSSPGSIVNRWTKNGYVIMFSSMMDFPEMRYFSKI